jgi:hypothetical protein
MKRALALLLLIPFLTVQTWAWTGGPYDSMVSRSAYAGTYGVAFEGYATLGDLDPDQFLEKANNQAVVGVMTMSVPSAGATSARVLLFSSGLMFLGNAQGTLNAGSNARSGKAKMTLLQQMSHYTAHTTSDGIQNQSGVVVDLILSGPLVLELKANYQTGLIEVTGEGDLYKFAPMLTAVKVNTSSEANTGTEGSDQSLNNNSTTTKTRTYVDEEGFTVTETVSETTSGPSTNQTSNSSTSGVIGSVNYDPNSVRQPPVTAGDVFIKLSAVGVREDTTVAVLAPFAPPSQSTFLQIDIPLPATGTTGTTGPTSGVIELDPFTRPVA